MHTLNIRTDGKVVTVLKQALLLLSLMFVFIPAIVSGSGLTAPPAVCRMLQGMFLSGLVLFIVLASVYWLFSRFSPVKWLKIRNGLIRFTRMFLRSEEDGLLLHSVRWEYSIDNGNITILLYPKGLEKDTADIGRRLSEYLGETLLKYEEGDGKAGYILGCAPGRYDGMEKMAEGIAERTDSNKLRPGYEPVPIYEGVVWDFISEAIHILLIAPSGAGKTYLLRYLGGMILNRGHRLYVIDAKNSDFGRVFSHAGVRVATNIEDIIQMLTELVAKMEERYATFYADDSDGADFQEKGMPGHFLIFDEILSVLSSAGKKEKEQIESLLQQIALKGRAAGFSIIITAQKLNATDLPKAITEQCQTRIVLGGIVSDETFHQATGMYKKDAGSVYRGGVGKGYAVTPKTKGLTYIETPLLPQNLRECLGLFTELRDRGASYGEGR